MRFGSNVYIKKKFYWLTDNRYQRIAKTKGMAGPRGLKFWSRDSLGNIDVRYDSDSDSTVYLQEYIIFYYYCVYMKQFIIR